MPVFRSLSSDRKQLRCLKNPVKNSCFKALDLQIRRQFKKLVLIFYSGWEGLGPWEISLISAGLAAKQETNCHKTGFKDFSVKSWASSILFEFSIWIFFLFPLANVARFKKVFKYSYSKYTHFERSFPFSCKLLDWHNFSSNAFYSLFLHVYSSYFIHPEQWNNAD